MLPRHPARWALVVSTLAVTATPTATSAGTGPTDAPATTASPPAPDTAAVASARGGLDVPPGSGRLILRHTGGGDDLMDIEVITRIGDKRTFLTRQRLVPGAQLHVDVPVPGPGDTSVQVRAQASGTTFALPVLVDQHVAVVSGRENTFTLVPRHVPATGTPISCPPVGPAPPAGATHVSTTDADLDGDGDPEPVSLWSERSGDERTWWLGATGLGSGQVITPLGPPGGFDPSAPWTAPRLLGAADADTTGTDELFAATAHGPSTRQVQLWALDGCALAPISVMDHAGSTRPATFAVGASGTRKAGLVCSSTGAGSTVAAWQAIADRTRRSFAITVTEHTWAGRRLLGRGTTSSWSRPATDEWTLLQAGGLRCGRPTYLLASGTDPGLDAPPVVTADPSFTG